MVFILGLILGSDGVFLILVGIVLFFIGLKKAMDNEDVSIPREKCEFLEKYYNDRSKVCIDYEKEKSIISRNTFRIIKKINDDGDNFTNILFETSDSIYQNIRNNLDNTYKTIYKKYNDLQDGKLKIDYDILKGMIKKSKWKIMELNNIDHLLDYLLLLSDDKDNKVQGYQNIVFQNDLFNLKPKNIDYNLLECFMTYGLLNEKFPCLFNLLYQLLGCKSYDSLKKQLNKIYVAELKKLREKDTAKKKDYIVNIVDFMTGNLNNKEQMQLIDDFFNEIMFFKHFDGKDINNLEPLNIEYKNYSGISCSINAFLDYMYEEACNDTEDLFQVIQKSKFLYNLKLDKDSFCEITMLFHFALFRELLLFKYSDEDVYYMIMYGVTEVAKHSKKFEAEKREEKFIEFFLELLKVIKVGHDYEEIGGFSFEIMATVYCSYIFVKSDLLHGNILPEDTEKFDNLVNDIIYHFRSKYENCDFIKNKIIE